MTRQSLLIAVAAIVACALGVSATASASAGPSSTTVLSPIIDGTVIDVDGDAAGDWTYDGFGSAVVGFNHLALGPGEDRGVLEFDLASLQRRCVSNAELLLNVAGSFSDFYAVQHPYFTVYAGAGDGELTTSDYSGAAAAGNLAIEDDVAVGVAGVLRRLLAPPPTRAQTVRFVLAWDKPASFAGSGGLLFGTSELEEAYGYEYRSADLAVESTPGVCPA